MAKPRSATRIAILVGSVRPASNTLKAARLLADELVKAGAEVDLVDPRALKLGVPGVDKESVPEKALQTELRGRVTACHGVAVVTPEYDGSYSAITKILVEALGYPSVVVGKPVTAVGVASGRIGAVRALEHLRGMLFNSGALVLPASPSVAGVHKCFDAAGQCTDASFAGDLRAAARELVDYATRLR